MVSIRNCTPHDINIIVDDDMRMVYAPSGIVARAKIITEVTNPNETPMIVKTRFTDVVGLPEPKPDTLYIVSSIVKMACPKRTDLLVPYDVVRNSNGLIIGCKGLSI